MQRCIIVDYGTADSLPEIESDGLVFARGGVVRSWQMVRVSDRSGNIIAYSYRNDKDPTSGHTVIAAHQSSTTHVVLRQWRKAVTWSPAR